MDNILNQVFSASEDELNSLLLNMVGMPKADVEAELNRIKSRIEEVALTIPTKGNKGDKGDKGDTGVAGANGRDGKDGKDGYQGRDGIQGKDGKDGLDGKDGVSIVDVNVAFDNHLVITLSDGTEIDAGVIGGLNENLQNVISNYVSNGANGTLIFKGLWNASTNSPTLSLTSSNAGDYYVVNIAGNTSLSGITDWQVNDWAVFNGTIWQKIDNSDLFNATNVAITGGSINGTTIGNSSPSTGAFTTLAASSTVSGTGFSNYLASPPTIGNTTPNTGKFTSVTTPSVTATTTDLTLSAISTGAVNLNTAGGTQFQVANAASANRFVVATGSNSGQPGLYASAGALGISGGGSAGISFYSNLYLQEQLRIAHTASAVNYVQVTGAATGGQPVISVQGSDATVSMYVASKSSGAIRFSSNGTTNTQLRIDGAVAAVNFLGIAGSTTGQAPILSSSSASADTNVSLALQPKGTGAIDLAAGSSGVNISNGGTVTAVTRTATGSNYTSPPNWSASAPTTAGGVTATGSVNNLTAASTPTIAGGGTGYTVGDTLTMVGGTFAPAIQVSVSSVSGGVITGVTLTNGGGYTVTPSNPVSVTGGTGSNATFNLNFGINASFTITNAGSGYIEQPTVTFSGGGGSAAAAYATVGSSVRLQSLGTTSEVAFAFRGASGINSPTAPDILRLLDTSALIDTGLTIQNSQFGRAQIQAYGNANGNLFLGSNGSGRISFTTNGTSIVEQFRVAHTASAVNYVQVTGGSTGNGIVLSAAGSDTNINTFITSKNASSIIMQTNGRENFRVADGGTSVVNNLQAVGSTTGFGAILQARGTDTNIDITLSPKGTGRVKFGTYTASAGLVTTGYVEIVDAGGTIRRLAVV